MAQGVYGTVRPSDVLPDDVEIILIYNPSRTDITQRVIKRLNSDLILQPIEDPINSGEIFGGLYNLSLPVSEFSEKGFYTLYIRPKQIRTKIIDVGVLSGLPNVKGFLIDLNTIPSDVLSRFENNNLVGYRVEYLNDNGTKVNNLFRIITSNNRSEPVNQNLTNTNQKAIRYRFNNNSSLVFCSVTPSSNNIVKPNVSQFIGTPNQNIILSNTFFNPIAIEIEMVEHDFDTIAYGLYGNQVKEVDNGRYTIFNFNNEAYKSYQLFEIRDEFSNTPLLEVKKLNVDNPFNGSFDEIVDL